MPDGLGQEFRGRIAKTGAQLGAITEEQSIGKIRDGGWTGKEILGHLLDSAANNHIRFVRAVLEKRYEGPTYAQKESVDLHGYGAMSWKDLLEQWRVRNALLTRVVSRIPEESLDAPCRIADHDAVTLRFLIVDYLDHMEQHVVQIAGIQS